MDMATVIPSIVEIAYFFRIRVQLCWNTDLDSGFGSYMLSESHCDAKFNNFIFPPKKSLSTSEDEFCGSLSSKTGI
jgi:hypothetical protein